MIKFILLASVLLICVSSSDAFFLHWIGRALLPTVNIIKHILGFQRHEPVSIDNFIYYNLRTHSGLHLTLRNTQGIEHHNIRWDFDLKIIVPGWYAQKSPWVSTIDAYIKRKNTNVVWIDWGYFNSVDYLKAHGNAKFVAIHMAKFILDLHLKLRFPLSKIHIIGFSLGAHVAGFIGKEIFKATRQKIGRITGLDPAGPMFGTPLLVGPPDRLHVEDAVFVDCIHTNEGIFGISQAIGHVDIFMNDGRYQPGCKPVAPSEINLNIFLQHLTCSHTKCREYFYQSIISNVLRAVKCDSYENLKLQKCDCSEENTITVGEEISTDVRGVYYCETNFV